MSHESDHGPTVVITQPSNTETVVRRRFAASAEELFAVWTDPELVRQWWPDDHDGSTTVTTRMEYSSQEWRDGHFAAGFEPGIRRAYERIDRLIDGRHEA